MKIHQEITFIAQPDVIFRILTDSAIFGNVTNAKTEIEAVEGGSFHCFDGMISGLTVEISPNERLVQAWRVANWEPGKFSIVRFILRKDNEEETTIVFDHTGFPEEDLEHLEQGWHNKYWTPIKEYLNA